MGKVKRVWWVPQVPMESYQFPMGKVKLLLMVESVLEVAVYQFPMGKVKTFLSAITKADNACINSLWER